MSKKNILKIIISSVIILLPIFFGIIMWNDLPDVITTHWGADGNADGLSGKAFFVFGFPAVLLGFHLLCVLFTIFDKKQKDQNQKALGIVFWILPTISLFVNGMMYLVALGKEVSAELLLPAIIGATFIFIGNYMPKISQNRTLGIKISWTLNNEENWNKTHRFAGKVWVAGGFALMLSAFLPAEAMITIVICMIAVLVIIPIAYSYSIYKKHKKEGIVYTEPPKTKSEKAAFGVTAVIVPLILIGCAVLMFTGNIDVYCNDTSLTVTATYWTDLEIDYSEIEDIEYRTDLDVGVRTSGFASAKLSLGIFQNKEFGSYTLYSHAGAKEHIVLTSGDKTLVIGMKEPRSTQAIYDFLARKLGK